MIGNEFLTDPDMLAVMLRTTAAIAVISTECENSAITQNCSGCHGSLRL